MMINNMESLEKFKFVDDIDKINELNTQARGQAVIIYFVVSLVITYFVYKIYLRNEMAAFSVQTSEHLEEKSNEIPIYANKGTSSPSDTVKSVCPHCNKEFQDNLSGTDCPDCGGTIL